MLQLILTDILFLALATMLYLVVRTLPRIEESGDPDRKGVFERMITSDIPGKVDETMNAFMGKTLRRMKINLMRFDNYLTGKLKTMNMGNGNGNGNGKNGDHNEYMKELTGPLEKEVEKEDNATKPSKK
ncbi:MAG: hypothetical protein RL681_70 [Candidatus Parcubacteria bacterium]|jgi:hypothetical protein